MKVTIIDYGLSNLLSVQHAFARFGAETLLTSDPAEVPVSYTHLRAHET